MLQEDTQRDTRDSRGKADHVLIDLCEVLGWGEGVPCAANIWLGAFTRHPLGKT